MEGRFISALPTAPDQGQYFIHPRTHKVRNTIIESDRAERLAVRLTNMAAAYRNQHGSYPPDLDTIFEFARKRRYTYPLPEGYWEYDPATGTATTPKAQ